MLDDESRLLLDSLPQIVGYADRELKLRWANKACRKSVRAMRRLEPTAAGATAVPGQPREPGGDGEGALLGRPIEELWGSRLARSVEPWLKRALSGERVSFRERVADRRGKEHELVFDLVPDQEEGEVAGCACIVRDLSSEREAANREELGRAELLEANRRLDAALADRERLIRELDHRVNNMLQVIQSILALEERYGADKPGADLVAGLRARLHGLSVLYAFLREPSEASGAEAGRVLERLCELCEFPARLEIEQGLRIPSAQLDSFVFIVLELMRNAPCPDGAPLIRLRSVPAGEGELPENSAGMLLEVLDSGPGLPAGESLEEPTHVGLILVRAFAASCGAELRYVYERGAVFSVFFPAAPACELSSRRAGA